MTHLLRIRLYNKSGKVISESPLRQDVTTKEEYEHIIATKKPIEYRKQKENLDIFAVGVLDISPFEGKNLEEKLEYRVCKMNENNEEIAVLQKSSVKMSLSRILQLHLFKQLGCYGYEKDPGVLY